MTYRELLHVLNAKREEHWDLHNLRINNDTVKVHHTEWWNVSKTNHLAWGAKGMAIFLKPLKSKNTMKAYIISVEDLLDSTVEHIGAIDGEDVVIKLYTERLMPMVANLTEDGITYTDNSGWSVDVYSYEDYNVHEPYSVQE